MSTVYKVFILTSLDLILISIGAISNQMDIVGNGKIFFFGYLDFQTVLTKRWNNGYNWNSFVQSYVLAFATFNA